MTKSSIYRVSTILLFIIGVFFLLYPTVVNKIYVIKQNKINISYESKVQDIDSKSVDKMLEDAQEYNDIVSGNTTNEDGVSGNLAYSQLLNVMGEQMGYIVIPKIDVNLPIYHYSSDDVLSVGVGHLENTSLPIGGDSTHCVLTGHTGLSSAKIFSDLEKLEIGDRFYIRILDRILCYEVDQILVVLPNDSSELEIIEDRDLVTLLTCTPYGINTHRLLVRGSRVEYDGAIDNIIAAEGKADSSQNNISHETKKYEMPSLNHLNSLSLSSIIVFVIVLIILVVSGIIILFVLRKKRKNMKKDKRAKQ